MTPCICANPQCQKALHPRQRRFCCPECRKPYSVRAEPGEVDAKMPTDDEIWERRHEFVVMDEAKARGIAYSTLGQRLNRRGWEKRRARKSGLTHAPCKRCREQFVIDPAQAERLCPECAGKAVEAERPERRESEYHREMARRMPGGDRYEACMQAEPCRFRWRTQGTGLHAMCHGWRFKRRAGAV